MPKKLGYSGKWNLKHQCNSIFFLQAVNYHCFAAFLSIPSAQFKLVLDSIIWAFKHTMRNVADTGLNILNQVKAFQGGNKQ